MSHGRTSGVCLSSRYEKWINGRGEKVDALKLLVVSRIASKDILHDAVQQAAPGWSMALDKSSSDKQNLVYIQNKIIQYKD